MDLSRLGPRLFLDFDGVVCNSLEECYRSSWLAKTDDWQIRNVETAPPETREYRICFDACRPFIRSGEDYLVVHEWAQQGKVPVDQNDFDVSLQKKGKETMAELKSRLYAVRDYLLTQHHSTWLSWNPLYPGMAQALQNKVNDPDVWILSTKKAEFIVEILRYHQVEWPAERVIYASGVPKLAILDQRFADRPAILIDDQMDHLNFSLPRVDCYLAEWGYISPGARKAAKQSLSLDQAVATITAFPVPLPSGLEGKARQR